jgi:hypothetical protein
VVYNVMRPSVFYWWYAQNPIASFPVTLGSERRYPGIVGVM